MITVLYGGGSLGTPKSDYVICARPLFGFIWLCNVHQSKDYHTGPYDVFVAFSCVVLIFVVFVAVQCIPNWMTTKLQRICCICICCICICCIGFMWCQCIHHWMTTQLYHLPPQMSDMTQAWDQFHHKTFWFVKQEKQLEVFERSF